MRISRRFTTLLFISCQPSLGHALEQFTVFCFRVVHIRCHKYYHNNDLLNRGRAEIESHLWYTLCHRNFLYFYLVELLELGHHKFTTKTSKNASTWNVDEYHGQNEVSNSPKHDLCPLSASVDTGTSDYVFKTKLLFQLGCLYDSVDMITAFCECAWVDFHFRSTFGLIGPDVTRV